ncbi:MAG TPA: glycosyl hydrolase, partial [Gemmatimonadaceae bacterium]|nr:glycosyl hydrolase [Gemmatimonadaceae bacterium]
DIVYVGTGEYDIRGNVSHGDGMFKSADAGKTWQFAGLADSRQIARVRVDPRDPNVVYAAVFGHVWVPDSSRGVYKSTDGGAHWRKVLFRNDSTGAIELVLDPTNPDILYAALWQAGRTPWLLSSGGAGSGIFKSTDAGEHWTELTHAPGLPNGVIGNIGLAVSPAAPNRVWALVEADSGGVFRSDDAGASWHRTNDERKLRQRAWYFSRIFADPKDSNRVYVLNVHMFRSDDGGTKFDTAIATPSTDNHDLWIAPNDPKRMAEANDGGATVSINGGTSWLPQVQPTAQFYHVETTNDFPYQVCGAQQDSGTLCGPSRWDGGIDIGQWEDVGGGESGYIVARADSPNVVFAGSYDGRLTRLDRRTHQMTVVSPWPDNPMGYSAGDIKYRFQWTYPLAISPRDPNTLYAGAQVLFRSRNDGASWQVISPDLTRHDPRTLGPSGGPITKDQTSVEYYGTIFAIAPSPVVTNEIWTGSDDGMIYLTRDGGTTWTNVTPPNLPDWMRISIIEP